MARIVLVFLRHFGCTFSKQHAAQLQTHLRHRLPEDVALVAIGIGTPDQIPAFKQETGFEGEVYVDPDPYDPQSYKLLKLSRGDMMVKHPNVKQLAQLSQEQGHNNGGYPTPDGGDYTGDIKQAGGIFVLGPGLLCDHSFRSEYAGHVPDLNDVLEAVTGTRGVEDIIYASTRHWLSTLHSSTPYSPSSPMPSATVGAIAAAALAGVLGLAFHSGQAHHHLIDLLLACAAAAVVWWTWRQLLRRQSAAAKPRAKSIGSDLLVDPATIKLMTPSDIDEYSIENDCADCDCMFIADTDMVHKTLQGDVVKDPSPAAAATGPTVPCKFVHELAVNNCYMREFLAKPHPLLGRKGPTCPFVPKSLKLNSLYIGKVSTPANACPVDLKRTAEGVVRHFLTKFADLEPKQGPKKMFKAIMLIFPDVPIELATEVIDGTQKALKAEFVKRGLMIGEFHLANNSAGLRNPSFYPLRTPYPALALRHMVPTDVVFMSSAHYTVNQKRQFLQGYIDCMGEATTKKAKEEVANARVMMEAL